MASSAILLFTDYFNHPSIPAYILAGIIVGRFFPQEEMLSFVQIGLAFLVFIFGVKMDPERLRSVAKESQIAGGIQITVIGLISLTAGYFLFNFNPINSILFTLSAVLSSTLVGLDILEREIHINLTHARLAESIHLTQDVIAILILIGLGSVQTILTNIPQNLYYGLMIIAASLAFRQILFDQLTKLTGGSRELMMLLSITVLSAFIGAAQYFNISLAVGSFAAGLAVSKYPYNIEILDTTGSLKDFFSAIFFVSLGALITTPTQKVLMVSALLIALTSIFKPYTVITALILQGHNKRTSYLTGMSIDQVSELALIIAIQTHLAGIMNDVLFQAIILTATFSMLTSSYTQRHKEEIYRFMSKYDILPDAETTIRTRIDGKLENHVILVGYDTQGKRLADKLKEENQQFVVLENDPEKVEELHDNNDNYIFSDIMEDETWQKAEIEEAKLIISTIPLRSASNKITGLETDADIILRSEEVKEAEKLLENDKVIYVNIPDMTGAELLSDHIEGIMENVNYREELRRKNMLELRKYLQSEEG
ncbi:cation:proton antiporter [Candidatus Nanohalovita haloferacivicina]|uniref:cation:proton antiporter n=1 Tax=Candidatus Nanohalovita haloferacivicina TaxID=2978046 RepID=UPI00325FD64D|nr:Kef-type K+ transport system, membrane componentKefB [Candidatus Nanohalobia archaeon BNXNv]